MCPFPHNNIPLLILHLRHQIAHLLDLPIQRVGRHVILRHVDDAVHVEGDVFCVGGPGAVVEAVGVFAVLGGGEGVVAGGNGAFVDGVAAVGVADLGERGMSVWLVLGGVVVVRLRDEEADLWSTYREVDFEVTAATEFAIANLECDGHAVVDVQLLMEAFL